MKIETTFSPGDKAWTSTGGIAREVTIGQVRVEITDTPGINGGCIEPAAPSISFDNYAPKQEREESYMAIETGIGSGSVYTLGVHIFVSRAEAEEAIEEANKCK